MIVSCLHAFVKHRYLYDMPMCLHAYMQTRRPEPFYAHSRVGPQELGAPARGPESLALRRPTCRLGATASRGMAGGRDGDCAVWLW